MSTEPQLPTTSPSFDVADISALAGECLMPRLQMEDYRADAQYRANTQRLVREGKAGGFCVFGGSPTDVAHAVLELQRVRLERFSVPLLFSADCEFGLPMRFTAGTEFPDAMAIARTGDTAHAYQVGRAIALEMRTLGLAWNFAPVGDVNSNPSNPIINTRAFGEDPKTVSRYAVEFALGSEEAGVASAGKHFPGHGDTAVDSHKEMPYVEGGWVRFSSLELPPFRAFVGNRIASIMPGHLATPGLAEHFRMPEESDVPATLSHMAVTRLLREELGFTGVVVTDALEMQAITKKYGPNDAVVRALDAGNDIALLPVDPVGAHAAVVAAVASGTLSIASLQEKVARIHALSERFRIDETEINASRLPELEQRHRSLARMIAERSLQVIGSIELQGAHWVILHDDRPQAESKANMCARTIRSHGAQAEIHSVKSWNAMHHPIASNTILVTLHRARGYIGGPASDGTMPHAIETISAGLGGGAPRGLVMLGSPYLDRHFERAPDFILRTFSESASSIEAGIRRVFEYSH